MEEEQKKDTFFFRKNKLFCILLAILIFICNCGLAWDGLYQLFAQDTVTVETMAQNDNNILSVSENDSSYDSQSQQREGFLVSQNGLDDMSDFTTDDWKLILVNKQHFIPDDYSFDMGKIKTSRGTMKCDKRIVPHLMKMIHAAEDEGIQLQICSPYRSDERQEYLFNKKVKTYMKQGMSYMDAYYESAQAVTIPGSSEHQIGLAFDIVSSTYGLLNEGFGETDAGIWLSEHSYEYGFILRYPLGKEEITGIEYEPWHFRYVGTEAATYMHENNCCLEEFIDLIKE